ncbi:MAG: hypothetical protein FGM50_08615 [Mycobacterium sp.]|nr:hypothetical protein [Mycobacterium sp.]
MREPGVRAVERRPAPRRGRWDAVAVAALALAVSAAGAARPSLWFDEAATLSAATRTVPELWRMVANIDAVHGFYYLLMHGWFAVFPATEFAARLSSAVAVGVAAAGVVVLGRQLSTRSVAVCAGVLFAILPRVTWAGAETRSYALTMAAAVWLTVFCVRAARRGASWWWLGYAVFMVAASILNVFGVLMLPVHGVVVILCGRDRGQLRRWAVAAAAASAAVIPFLFFAQTQMFQVQWISPPGAQTLGEVFAVQYFDDVVPFVLLAVVMLVSGLLRLGQAGNGTGYRPGRLVAVTAVWIVVPTIALLIFSVLRDPVYYPRYLSFTAPAVALLLGACVTALARSRVMITTTLLVFALAAAPNYLTQRGPYAKEQMDYSQIADVIDRYAAPGDCLVLDNSAAWKPGPIRPLTAARPAVYQKLRDYGRGMTAIARNRLWDNHIAVWAWADKMPGCPALWTITERDPTLGDYARGQNLDPGPRLARTMAYQVPSRFGFHPVQRWQFSFAQVVKSTR